jgi:hypothetical protein
MLYPLVAGEEVRRLCAIEAPWEIASFIALGIGSGERPQPPKRRAMERITKFIGDNT